MRQFSFYNTEIDGLLLIDTFRAEDERGSFVKDYSVDILNQAHVRHPLKEVFYTYSQKGVIRAMHFQREKTQAKLVRCVSGRIFDVVLDLRKGSSTYGKWQSFELCGEDKDLINRSRALLIPGTCAHGYLVLEPSVVSYKCDEVFYGEFDDGIFWDDPDLAIPWPVNEVEEIILSQKDRNLQSFKAFTATYGGL